MVHRVELHSDPPAWPSKGDLRVQVADKGGGKSLSKTKV